MARNTRRAAADFAATPVATRIEDSLWALPDGRRFVAGYASDFALVLEVVDLQHVARYPSAAMIDTFWNDPRSPEERQARRIHDVHNDIHEFGGLWSSRDEVELDPLPSGSWWLFEQPSNGDWLELFSEPLWSRLRGGETTAIIFDRVKHQLEGIQFAPVSASADPLPNHCARHGEPHSRLTVGVRDPCPLCGRVPTIHHIERWLAPGH